MQIDWTTRSTYVPDPLRKKVQQVLAKIERILHGEIDASVVVQGHGVDGAGRRSVELIVRTRLGTFAAKDESHDLTDSVNAVLARVQAQIHRAHDKIIDGRRKPDGMAWTPPVGEVE